MPGPETGVNPTPCLATLSWPAAYQVVRDSLFKYSSIVIPETALSS
jgi:hypothetical protein